MDRSAIIDGFAEALSQGTRYSDPFLLYRFTPFSRAIYDQILNSLPEDHVYMDLKHGDAMLPNGRSSRRVFPLKADRVRNMLSGETRDFWLEFIDILKAPELCDVFKRAFEAELLKRFAGVALSEVPAIPTPMLMRDIGMYRIGVHSDIDTKVITTQYYLPRDESRRHLGTNIHRRRADGKFEFVRKLDFVPGNSYAFAVSKYSWHSVDALGENEEPRNSMMLVYFRAHGIDY